MCEFLESVGSLQVYVVLKSTWETVFLDLEFEEGGEKRLHLGKVRISKENGESVVERDCLDLSSFSLTERRRLTYQVIQVSIFEVFSRISDLF